MSFGNRGEALKRWLARWYLVWSVRGRRVAGQVYARTRPCDNLRRVDPAAVYLAAVQMRADLSPSAEDYAAQVADLARRAAEQGAQLIAFPEDAAVPLLGMVPQLRGVLGSGSIAEALSALGSGVTVTDVLRFVVPAVQRAYQTTFRALARRLGVYIHAGSAMLPDPAGQVYNVSYLFGPDGRILARSSKAHLLPLEADWGLARGETVTVVDTLLGRVGMPICADATYWETFRILYLLGAEIAVLPTANPEPYDAWRALRGLWPRLQESPMFGVQACLVGQLFGLELTGKSGVYGPYPLSPRGDGVWCQVSDPAGEGVVVAAVDLRRLHEFRAEEGVDQAFNPHLYEHYLPRLYERAERRARSQPSRSPRNPRRSRRRRRSRRIRQTAHGA